MMVKIHDTKFAARYHRQRFIGGLGLKRFVGPGPTFRDLTARRIRIDWPAPEKLDVTIHVTSIRQGGPP